MPFELECECCGVGFDSYFTFYPEKAARLCPTCLVDEFLAEHRERIDPNNEPKENPNGKSE